VCTSFFGETFATGTSSGSSRNCRARTASERRWLGRTYFATFDAALRLLHPFMPFLTEELWHQLPQKAGAKSIALDQFPETQSRWKNVEAQKNVALIQEVVTALRTIRAELKARSEKESAGGLFDR